MKNLDVTKGPFDRNTRTVLSCSRKVLAIALSVALWAAIAPARAQERYDDHDLKDRFYITLGGFSQTEIRTTLRLDATTSQGGIALGTVISLENQFDLDNQVSTGRLDAWYRFNERHRLGLTYWQTDRSGVRTYNQRESISIGDITIEPGDNITTQDDGQLVALKWSYSFVNTSKYEAWLGVGLNFQKIDTTIGVNVGGGTEMFQESAGGTVPIPTLNFGGIWNFNKRWRMLLTQELFGIKVGDFTGKLNNTRVLAEFSITGHFGLGAGFERFSFEVDAKGDDFRGQFDTSYTGLSLYLKGQF